MINLEINKKRCIQIQISKIFEGQLSTNRLQRWSSSQTNWHYTTKSQTIQSSYKTKTYRWTWPTQQLQQWMTDWISQIRATIFISLGSLTNLTNLLSNAQTFANLVRVEIAKFFLLCRGDANYAAMKSVKSKSGPYMTIINWAQEWLGYWLNPSLLNRRCLENRMKPAKPILHL